MLVIDIKFFIQMIRITLIELGIIS